MFCKNCGQEIEDSARFCPACGRAVERPACETTENPAAPTAPAGTHAPFLAKYPAAPPQAQPPAGMNPEGAASPTAKKKKTGVIFLCTGLVLVILAAAFAGIWVWKGNFDNTPDPSAAGTPDSSAARHYPSHKNSGSGGNRITRGVNTGGQTPRGILFGNDRTGKW